MRRNVSGEPPDLHLGTANASSPLEGLSFVVKPTDVDCMWCRALVEEIGDRPDLIERITRNYNRQREHAKGE